MSILLLLVVIKMCLSISGFVKLQQGWVTSRQIQLIDKNIFLHTKISYFAQNMQFWGSRICESPLALSWLMVDILLTSFLMLATLSRS